MFNKIWYNATLPKTPGTVSQMVYKLITEILSKIFLFKHCFWMINQITNLHMSHQLSCRVMWSLMTLLDHYLSYKHKIKVKLRSHKLLMKQVPGPSINKRARWLTTRTRKILGFNLFDCSVIWQVPRQHCCRGTCQISERYEHCNVQSSSFEIW